MPGGEMRVLIVSADPRFRLPHSGARPIDYFLADSGDVEGSAGDEADIVYLDSSSMDPDDFSRALSLLKRGRAGRSWGVADPGGLVEDPAELFRDGASDYLGPAVLAGGVDPGRWKRVLDWAEGARPGASAAGDREARGRNGSRSAPKHGGAFPGWASLKAGEERDFYFLYAAPSDPAFVKSKIGETRYQAFKERFRGLFAQALSEADALPWMQNDSAVIYLVPPRTELARAAVIAGLKALLASRIIAHERLGINFPLSLTLALHKGKSPYQPPGKTGTIIADDVNFIHHLGLKRAEADRLTVTAPASDALPEEFMDFFIQAGEFEERCLRHSRRFVSGRL
jgi:hypothetical protein